MAFLGSTPDINLQMNLRNCTYEITSMSPGANEFISSVLWLVMSWELIKHSLDIVWSLFLTVRLRYEVSLVSSEFIYTAIVISVLYAAGTILCMRPANERWRYILTSSLIGWMYTQNDPWCSIMLSLYNRRGMGVTKALLINFCFGVAKVWVRSLRTHSYLPGVATTQLWRHLANRNIIFSR